MYTDPALEPGEGGGFFDLCHACHGDGALCANCEWPQSQCTCAAPDFRCCGICEGAGTAAAVDNLVEREEQRLARIAAGVEHACAACGCSETRACPGGCVWATQTLCSRCA